MSNYQKPHRTPDQQVVELAEKYEGKPEALLEILKELNSDHHFLKKEIIADVARSLNIPEKHAYGVASFYSMLSLELSKENIVRVCDGPVCWLGGSSKVHKAINEKFKDHPKWTVERSSCLGLCDRAPAININNHQGGPLSLDQINNAPLSWTGNNPDYSQARPGELRVMLAKAGIIDPNSIESALENGAFLGLEKSLNLSGEDVINQVEESGLAGRGGAGFPVGRKWRFVSLAESELKYVICNADESEPLIFKDRVLIDTNPQQILEGMAIAGYATGASEAFIYIRGEYEQQALKLERAVQQAEYIGWLGDNIQGSGFSFHVHVHRGAGAYICGEETALIESLEGKRGEPRLRPPYPPSNGYRGLPTLVNNVESFAAIPSILRNGAEWYLSFSGSDTPGTKLYMILGHIKNPGIFEAPFDLTLREIIDQFGGGMRSGSTFQFALTGGAAGTIVPEFLLDIPINYQSASKGVSLGAGAFLICDQTVSAVEFLHQLMHFFESESCGKCTPCRVGTHRIHHILGQLSKGEGKPGDINKIADLANYMFDASFCGLGQSVSVPINSALKNFAPEFKAAIKVN